MPEYSVLIVEDHQLLAETVTLYLEHSGWVTDYAADGLSALHLATVNNYDAVVLDVMLPGLSGFEICRRLRQEGANTVPILLLTARDQLEDKLQGFREGADDYLIKPFDLPELEARLLALIRRQRGEFDEQVISIGDLKLNTRTREVSRQGQPIRLTPTTYKILRILMRESPHIVTKETLEHELWGDMLPDSDTLRSHLYQLRKLIDKPFDKPLLHTQQGVGVRLSD